MAVNVGGITRSRRLYRWLPWISGLVLLAGIIAFLVTHYNNTAAPSPKATSTQPAVDVTKKAKKVPLSKDARAVAGKFIVTAVRRKNLDQAWKLVGPGIKQGMTLKEWRTGNIAVVPYTHDIDKVGMKIDYSHKNDAQLQVAILPKDDKVKGQLFFMQLVRVGRPGHKHWVVDYWSPRISILLPQPS